MYHYEKTPWSKQTPGVKHLNGDLLTVLDNCSSIIMVELLFKLPMNFISPFPFIGCRISWVGTFPGVTMPFIPFWTGLFFKFVYLLEHQTWLKHYISSCSFFFFKLYIFLLFFAHFLLFVVMCKRDITINHTTVNVRLSWNFFYQH